MAYESVFRFAPAEWLPVRDQKFLDEVATTDLTKFQGKLYENPDFEFQMVWDVHNYFVTDLFHRISLSHSRNEKLVVILPSPENSVYISLAEILNKNNISCRNVHIFFLYEYANENGDVAHWQSPYSRSGQFMRHFYERLKPELRMPVYQIHFWTKENYSSYSQILADNGGADAAYTTLNWFGGIGGFDAENYPAETMDDFLNMGARYVPHTLENIAMDSLRGMFGCSGDIGNVPPYVVTLGPKDIVSAKYGIHVQFLASCGEKVCMQKFPLRLALLGPITPQNPGSIMRLFPGVCYCTYEVGSPSAYAPDRVGFVEYIAEIAAKEATK